MRTAPTHVQADEATLAAHKKREDAGEINIWSGRRIKGTGGGGQKRTREVSQYRCRPEVDVGRTRGSDAKQMQFCLYFAK